MRVALSRLFYNLDNATRNYEGNSIIIQQIREADEINIQFPPLTTSLTGTLTYATHPQAIYTSRLLDYENLPEPKNVDNNDNPLETLYSGD